MRSTTTSNNTKYTVPFVWVLLGGKAGDNNQVLALAESLGWGWTEKHLQYIAWELIPNRLLKVTLLGLKRQLSDDLGAPWPDLVITAGRRNEPVARWIQKQSEGKCRLIHLGRPWARPKHFDLVITTPQYDLPEATNILHNNLPLHRINVEKLQQAAKQWTPAFAHLPRPLIAILIGGNSSNTHFSSSSLRTLAQSANAMATEQQGALLVTTSARSPAGTLAMMQQEINVPALFFDYNEHNKDNPYNGFLALADAFIVTADSISMLTESCATEKPVFIFDIAGGPSSRAFGTWLRDHLGPRRLRRDISRIHTHLIQQKRISRLGENSEISGLSANSKDLVNAVDRVKKWFPND